MALKEKIIKFSDIIIESGFLAMIFLIPVLFDFTLTNYNAFNLLKAVVFRVILSLILLAYSAKIFITGKISYRGGNKIFLFVLLLLFSFFISSFFSLEPALSFWGSYERQQGFYNLASYLLFFALLILNIRGFKQIKRLLVAAVAAGLLTCLYGLAQLLGLDPLPWKEGGLATGRIFSSLGQPNFFGHYLVMVIPMTLYGMFFITKRFLARFFIGLVILAELVCLVNTYSRAAWLGGLAAAAVFLIIFLVIRGRNRLALAFGIFLLVGAGLMVSLNYFSPNNPSGSSQLNAFSRLKSLVDLRSGSGRMRLYYWQAALAEIGQAGPSRLLLGFGPDALAAVFIKYYQPDWAIYEVIDTYPDRAHNWLFDVILSYGFLGLAAMLWFYGYLIYRTAKFLLKTKAKPNEEIWLVAALSASLAAYSVNNLFSFSLFTGQVYLFFILAIWWAVVGGRETRETELRLTPASKALIWLALVIVVGLFIYLRNVNLVKADYYYMKAKKAERQADCRGVLANLAKAVNYDPGDAYYRERYIFHGLNCFSSIVSRESQVALRDNLEEQIKLIGPDEPPYATKLTIARADSLFGFYVNPDYYGQAEKIFNDLIAAYPRLLTPYQDFGRMKMWQKNYTAALALFKRAESQLPDLNHPQLNRDHKNKIIDQAVSLYEKMGYSYNQLKNYERALSYYRKALVLNPRYLTLYKNLADVYYEQGLLDQAIKLNQRGRMLNPSDYHWPLALSFLYRDKKDLIAAKEYLNQAIRLAPENEELKKYYSELNK